MYTEVIRVIGEAQPKVLNSDCRLVIHNMAKRQCRLIYTLAAKPLERPDNLIAEFIFSTKPIYTIAWLLETEREVNRSRVL